MRKLPVQKAVWLLRICLFVASLPSSGFGAGVVAVWGDAFYDETTVPWNATNVVKAAAGATHIVALRVDGTLVGWGDNQLGQTTIPVGLSNCVEVAAGAGFSVALMADGAVAAWGDNIYGEQNLPAGLSNVVAISARQFHALALRADGTAAAWGYNGYGEGAVPQGLSNIASLAAGYFHNLALKADGTVVAWGNNNHGQTNVPAGLGNVVAISGGGAHSLALTADGKVIAWGDDSFHQSEVPPGLSDVTAIAAGLYHSLALRADGTVVAWGEHSAGESSVPPLLTAATGIACGDFFSLAVAFEGPVEIVLTPVGQTVHWGSNLTYKVMASGTEPLAYQWLFNGGVITNSARVTGVTSATLTILGAQFDDQGVYSVLVTNGISRALSAPAPLTVVGPPILTLQPGDLTVGAGSDVTLGIQVQGTAPVAFQWLLDGTEILGATNLTLRLTDVQPAATGVYSIIATNAYGSTSTQAVLTVTNRAPTLPNITRNTLSGSALVPLNGGASLQSNSRGSEPLSYQWFLNGVEAPGATNAALSFERMSYAQSGVYSLAVSNAFGGGVCPKVPLWATEAYVWQGDGFNYNYPDVEPLGLTNLQTFAIGDLYALALRRDGTPVCWPFETDIPYGPVTNVPYGLADVRQVASGYDFSVALRGNSTVLGWGHYPGPQTPTNLVGISQIAAGGNHALALRTNGTVAFWGYTYGPSNELVGLSNAVAVAAGVYHSMALRADGTVAVWNAAPNQPGLSNVVAIAGGKDTCLALKADGTVTGWNSSFAKPPAGLSNVVAIAAGDYWNVALRADGSVVTWGRGSPDPVAGLLSNVTAVAAGADSLGALIGDGSPALTIQPFDHTAERAGSATFRARVTGVQPMSYQWFFDGKTIAGATNASLTLTNLGGSNIGEYMMSAVNALGTTTSAVAHLTIPYRGSLADALNVPGLIWTNWFTNRAWFGELAITHDGDAAAQTPALTDNESCLLQTAVYGPGTLSFWWKVSSEEGFDILSFWDDGGPSRADISGEVDWLQETFTLGPGYHRLNWGYAKDASVSIGLDAGWVDQVVYTPGPPSILQQPQGQTVWYGTDVELAVVAIAEPPVRYQWFRNGKQLVAATEQTLTLTNVTRRDSGLYNVVVGNSAGSTASSNALVAVLVPQRLTGASIGADGIFGFGSGDADGGALLPGDITFVQAQVSTNLLNWTNLPGVVTLTNGILWIQDPVATNYPVRYYRVVERVGVD